MTFAVWQRKLQHSIIFTIFQSNDLSGILPYLFYKKLLFLWKKHIILKHESPSLLEKVGWGILLFMIFTSCRKREQGSRWYSEDHGSPCVLLPCG